MAKDSYSTTEAAKILGLSERRVRQLVAEGKLAGERDGEGNLRLAQAAVHTERRQRRNRGRKTTRKAAARTTAAAPEIDTDAIAETVAAVVTKAVEGQLQITQKAESLARQELDQERARARELEQQLADARAQLAAAEARLAESGKRRGMFRRKEASGIPTPPSG